LRQRTSLLHLTNMTDAFIETTVLTNLLLKKDGSEVAAEAAIAKFATAIVPQFAWKEFKRGPLANFVWAFNKLADTRSFVDTLAALQRMSLSPKRYLTSTAIQALHTAFIGLFSSPSLTSLRGQYGDKADADQLHADLIRLELKRTILGSWGKRHSLYGGAQEGLDCYPDADLTEKGARLEINPRDCPKGTDCCLRSRLSNRRKDLGVAKNALPKDGRKETRDRYHVLRQLEKHPSSLMDPKDCRKFGDAYFVLFCPDDAEILTTNVRDFQPMADALGVTVSAP
jgi:hypothetical protein